MRSALATAPPPAPETPWLGHGVKYVALTSAGTHARSLGSATWAHATHTSYGQRSTAPTQPNATHARLAQQTVVVGFVWCVLPRHRKTPV